MLSGKTHLDPFTRLMHRVTLLIPSLLIQSKYILSKTMRGYTFQLAAPNFTNTSPDPHKGHCVETNHLGCSMLTPHMKCLSCCNLVSLSELSFCSKTKVPRFLVARMVILCLKKCFLLTIGLRFKSSFNCKFSAEDNQLAFKNEQKALPHDTLTQTCFLTNRCNRELFSPAHHPSEFMFGPPPS